MRACGWRCEVHSPDAGWFLSSLQNEIIYSQLCQVTISHQCLVPFSLSSWSVPSLPPPASGEVMVPSCTVLVYLNKAGPKQHQRKLQVLQVFFGKLLMFSSSIFVINIVGFPDIRSNLLLLKQDEAALRIKHRSHKQPGTVIIFRPPGSLKFHRSGFVCCLNWDSGVKTWYIFDFLHFLHYIINQTIRQQCPQPL